MSSGAVSFVRGKVVQIVVDFACLLWHTAKAKDLQTIVLAGFVINGTILLEAVGKEMKRRCGMRYKTEAEWQSWRQGGNAHGHR